MLPIDPTALLIVLSAPSGGGKTTLCEKLLEANPTMTRAITCTTRPPRPGEKEGRDYYFLDRDDFIKRVEDQQFLEHATVFGNHYGILKSEVLGKLQSGKDVLLNVDVQGAATIRQQAATMTALNRALISVFLTPPKMSILEERLRRRAQDSEEVIQKRLAVARQEVLQWERFDYLIISTSIAEDFRRMQAILEAEKMRQYRCDSPILD